MSAELWDDGVCGHESLSGIDGTPMSDPAKLWRCHECDGLFRWEFNDGSDLTGRHVPATPDEEIRAEGFRGYVDCPALTSPDGCPTPFRCSERGDCPTADSHSSNQGEGL